ncbi:MAG: hypothetical protein GXZ07_06875 [Firmicutes bacterium]|nr:hypothetical protein [Bacillota bacterium]
MYAIKNKDYFPYALSCYFSNNSRWPARVFNSPQYKKLAQKKEQLKKDLLKLISDERQTAAEAILEKIEETLSLLGGISNDEIALEGFRAGLELGELLYGNKALEALLHENAFVEVEEKKAGKSW